MKKSISVILLFCFFSFTLQGQKKMKSEFRYSTYKGLVMCGYQGWHNTPDDGSLRGWTHLGKGNNFKPGFANIDLWPDVSEYSKTYITDFKMADSTNALI
jgi:glycoprotein endo-alpha-1,2-mannosidase